jgi:hypothetical protein
MYNPFTFNLSLSACFYDPDIAKMHAFDGIFVKVAFNILWKSKLDVLRGPAWL